MYSGHYNTDEGVLAVFIMQNRIHYLDNVDPNSVRPGMNLSHLSSLEVVRMDLPFVLTNLHPQSVRDMFTFKLIASEKCIAFFFWDVNIKDLFIFIHKTWKDITFLDTHFMNEPEFFFQKRSSCSFLEGSTLFSIRRPKNLKSPESTSSEELCNYFPLVIILVRHDLKKLGPKDPIAWIFMIHVNNDVCPHPNTILAQYLKYNSGHLSVVKSMYLNGIMSDGRLDSDVTENNLCVVCFSQPVTVGLLPCRHICLCSTCRSKIELCPLCRITISFSFEV